MKKRIIWFTIFSVLVVCALVILLNENIFMAIQNALSGTGFYAWAKENFHEIWNALRYGPHGLVVVSIFGILFITLITFKTGKVEDVNDETMPVQEVTQTQYVYTKEGKPELVVVKEEVSK